MRNSKTYRLKAHGGGYCDNTPSCVVFTIDEEFAIEIVKLSSLVKAHGLAKVERSCPRARFLQFDPETEPEQALEAGDENDVRTECDALAVEDQDFSFWAYIKHTDEKVYCEGQPISELISHFGMAAEIARPS